MELQKLQKLKERRERVADGPTGCDISTSFRRDPQGSGDRDVNRSGVEDKFAEYKAHEQAYLGKLFDASPRRIVNSRRKIVGLRPVLEDDVSIAEGESRSAAFYGVAEDSDEDLRNSASTGGRFRDVVSSGEIEGKKLTLVRRGREEACGMVAEKKASPLKERSVNGEKREVLRGDVMDESGKEEEKGGGFSFWRIRGRSGKYDVQAVEKAAFGNDGIIGSRRLDDLDDKLSEHKSHEQRHLGRLFGGSSFWRAGSNKEFESSNETISNSALSLKAGPAGRVLDDVYEEDSEEDRLAANDHEGPKTESRRRIARLRLGGSNKAIDSGKLLASKGGSRGFKNVIEGSASEDEMDAVERYSSASDEEPPIRRKGRAASKSDFYVGSQEIEGSFIDFEGSVRGSSNTISGYDSECEQGSGKGKPRAFVALRGLVKRVNRAKTQSISDDDNSDNVVKKSRFRVLKNLLKKRNKVPESVIAIEEKKEQKRSFSRLKETGLGIAAVCACIYAMAIVFKVCNKTSNKGGIQAYIACVLATIIGVAVAVAVLYYGVPRVVDKTKAQSSSGKKGCDIFKKDCLFWVIEFKDMGIRYGYLLAKKMAAKSVPAKHLGFNNNGKLLFKGISVPEKVCTTFTVFGNKCSEIMEGGKCVITRIHFQDPNSMTFLRKICPATGEDLRDYLTFKTLKVDVKDAYRFSACFKYRFADREAYVRFALAMAQAGCNELLIAYLSSFMPKASYACGEKCDGLSLRFMKTKEWKLLCFDEARFGLLSKISTYCKRGIIEDQRKFLKCFLDAYNKHVPANSKHAWGGKNGVDCSPCVRGEKGPGFPFSNPRYVLALDRLAKGCGARVEEDVYTGYRAFIKDENMRFGLACAVFVTEGTVDCVYDYSDKYCTRETIDTYLSNMRKEQVYRGWCRPK